MKHHPWMATVAGLIGVGLLAILAWWIRRPAPVPPPPTAPPEDQLFDLGPGDPEGPEMRALGRALEACLQVLRHRFLDPAESERAVALLTEAAGRLHPAHADRPAFARIVAMFEACMGQQPSFAQTNWKELEQRVIELRNYPTLGKFTDRMHDWTRAETTAKVHLDEGEDCLRTDRHGEAFLAFRQIGADSVYAKEASNRMNLAKTAITDRALAEVPERIRVGQYRGAIGEIERVLVMFDGKYPDVVAALDPLRRECEKNVEYEDLIAEIENLCGTHPTRAPAGVAAVATASASTGPRPS